MRELFGNFHPEFKDVPVSEDVQYAYQLMAWMGGNFSSSKTIKDLMFWVANNCLNTRPHIYQIGQNENSIETDVPYYAQSGETHTIVVPTGFNEVLTLPFRMQPVMVGLVEAASQMRWDGNYRFVEYHKEHFMGAITKVLV